MCIFMLNDVITCILALSQVMYKAHTCLSHEASDFQRYAMFQMNQRGLKSNSYCNHSLFVLAVASLFKIACGL